jgi:N-methylhydantoinase B/oxoprolinase/acetone carboxylase alpha subunit
VGKSDAEEEMVRFPWDVVRYQYRMDAHGAGKWRGAPGVVWEAVNEGGEARSNGGPAERDPEAVRQDVRNELVSLEAAYDSYRVVLDPASLEIDVEATAALRTPLPQRSSNEERT